MRGKIGELAMRSSMPSRVLRFGSFVLDVAAFELRKRGRSIKVERRPMELLMLLVDRRGKLVTRDEIAHRLWGPDVFVDVGAGVNTAIRKLRRVLHDSADHSRFIQTVQGKGYRFIAEVEPAPAAVLWTQNSEAYDSYLRGRYYYNQMTPGTGARALDCYGRATALDPAYALAWAGIAATYSSRLFNSDARPSDVSDQAHAAAEKAMTSGGSVPEAHTSAAIVQFLFNWDWRSAEAHARHAIALDSSSAQAHWMLGYASSQQGRHDEALAAARRARELDPLSALNHSMSAQIAFSARDFEAAALHARQALLAEPDFWVAHWQLGQARQQMGQTDHALEALGEAARLSNGNSKPVSLSAYILATIGRVREAREMLVALEQRAQSRYVPPCAMALVYAGLNDDARVFEWLDNALTVRDVHLIYAPVDPKWDRFRKDERFETLLRRCGSNGEARSTQSAT
jgi:DNA-binding winged helix-turn-helix (wHTH) protein/Flp pilus assembly protein TadD